MVLGLAASAAAQSGWTLTWSDEFDGASLDQTKWGYDLGASGWGNSEWEYYTNRTDNVYLEGGKLVIKAIKESYLGSQYTSGRILTRDKFSQAYGRFEARIKIPYGQGMWPAFWMMGSNSGTVGWPTCGELDIMENIGKEPNIVHGTMHGPGYSGGNGIGAPYSLPVGQRFADDFHLYAIEWEPDVVRWYVDDQLYKTVTRANIPAGTNWVFDHPFYVIMNVAVGGGWRITCACTSARPPRSRRWTPTASPTARATWRDSLRVPL
jgi:beta-glucanase (GH16 family)